MIQRSKPDELSIPHATCVMRTSFVNGAGVGPLGRLADGGRFVAAARLAVVAVGPAAVVIVGAVVVVVARPRPVVDSSLGRGEAERAATRPITTSTVVAAPPAPARRRLRRRTAARRLTAAT